MIYHDVVLMRKFLIFVDVEFLLPVNMKVFIEKVTSLCQC